MNEINKTHAERKQVSNGDFNVTKMENVETDSNSDIKWGQGRSAVDLDQLVKDLNNCKRCSNHSNLPDTVKETRDDLASVLHVKCDVCATINSVLTGRRHSESRRSVLVVNS